MGKFYIWISFVDKSKPKGERFLGVFVSEVEEGDELMMILAPPMLIAKEIANIKEKGIYPSGNDIEPMAYILTGEFPNEDLNKLLSAEHIEEKGYGEQLSQSMNEMECKTCAADLDSKGCRFCDEGE